MEQEIQQQSSQLNPIPPKNKIVIAVVSLLIIALLATVGYFIFSKRLIRLVETQTQQTDTTSWKTYRNDQYGFEVKHPSELAPWEGFSIMYDQSALPAVLRVCFGPEVQTKNYCGVELYVVREDQFPKINSNTFLGFPRRLVEELEFKPWFGNEPGTGIETYDPQRPKRIIRNGFLKHNGFVYLFVAYNSEEFQKLQAMVASFTFLTQSPDISKWKSYRNEKYKFEIKYPPNLEPLEGQALFFRPPEFSPLLNVCFASVARVEFYCEAELYIAPSFGASPQNLKFLNANTFLGLNRCAEEGLRPQPKFDNIQGSEVDTCGEEGGHRNAFVIKDSFLYLFSTEPSVGYTIGKDVTFQGMIDSFDFINPNVSELNQSGKVETDEWKIFKSEVLGYELKYPDTWGFAKQGDGLVDFGPGSPKPAGGKLQLDMQCLYGTETQIYGEETTSTKQQISYGSNQFTEKKIFVVSGSEKNLAFHNFTIKLPSEYAGNQCKTASFIVREEFDQKALEAILSTFQLVQ